MKTVVATALLVASLSLSSCSEQEGSPPLKPFALTEEAMGRYCGMNVLEHPGPKGQIILEYVQEAIWFSSARDTLAFTMLPEEPREIAAIYVSDMGKAPSWEQPGADNWIDAKQAVFVIGSSQRGGMGTQEAVPFSQVSDAEAFAQKHGGQVVDFEEIPPDYILGSDTPLEGDQGSVGDIDGSQGHEHG